VAEEMPHAVIADRYLELDQLGQQCAASDVGFLGESGSYPLRLIGQRERLLLVAHRQRPGRCLTIAALHQAQVDDLAYDAILLTHAPHAQSGEHHG
jgi:hypothetical protein